MLNIRPLFSFFNNATRRDYSTRLIVLNRELLNKRKPPLYTSISKMSCGDTKFVTFEELQNIKDNNSVLVIDVREPEELKETGVIPGSINIPLKDLANTLKTESDDKFNSKYHRNKPDINTTLVFSCKAGIRSQKAQNIAVDLGFSNVRNYKGGWIDWEKHTTKN